MQKIQDLCLVAGAMTILVAAIFLVSITLPLGFSHSDGVFSLKSIPLAVADGDGGDGSGGSGDGSGGSGDGSGGSGDGSGGSGDGSGDGGDGSGGSGDGSGDGGDGSSGSSGDGSGDGGDGSSGSSGDGGDGSSGGPGDGGPGGDCCKPTCPPGYTGIYPNCIPPKCPPGYSGTYPHCVPPPMKGCIDVVKETFNTHGQPITPVAQFTFQLDGGATVQNNSAGLARFNNVTVGTHTVSEIVPNGWDLVLVTPSNGVVNVPAGNQCATVVFKNKQKTPPPSTPVCDISAYPTTVAYGGSSTLTWTSSNAASASINQGIGSVAVNGSQVVSNLMQTKTFTLIVTGPGGTAQCQTTVTVNDQPHQPYCEIWADDTTIGYGESTTLRWDSTNATSATLSGVGSVAVDGSRSTGALFADTYYSLTVTGPGGTAQCMVTVYVEDEQHEQPSCDIWADDEWLESGEGTTLHWDSEYATSANLTQFGSVSTAGTRWTGALYATKTYTLNVSGPGGSAQCSVTITVEDTPDTSPSCVVSANPSSVQQGGSATLTWDSQNATSAHLSSVGGVPVDGNRLVTPWTTTTYTLTVYDWDGESAQCTTTVGVTSIPCGGTCNPPPPPCTSCGHSGGSTDVVNNNTNENYNTNNNTNENNITINVPAPVVNNVYPSFPGYPGYQYPQYPHNYPPRYEPAPYCTIHISDYGYGYGYGYGSNQRTLTWSSTHATSAFINPEIGSVSTSGSRTVWGSDYTMTVYGPGGTATCRTGSVYVPPPTYYPPVNHPPVVVNPPVYYPPVVHHPIPVQIPQRLAAAHVALTQIPYTGFGLGEFGTAMYWLSIVMIAALGAGALVHFRSDMFSLAGVSSLFKKDARSARLREFLGEETPAFTPTRLLGIR